MIFVVSKTGCLLLKRPDRREMRSTLAQECPLAIYKKIGVDIRLTGEVVYNTSPV